MGPQSRPVEFSPSCVRRRRLRILADRCGGGRALRRVPFPRVERHDRFAGGLKPREKVIEAVRASHGALRHGVIALGGVGPPVDRGTFCCPPRRVRRAPTSDVRLREDCSQCSPTAAARGSGSTRAHAQGLWRIGRPPIRPVLKHGPGSLTCARVTESH